MDYDDYVTNSPIWDTKRRMVLERASFSCERCNEHDSVLEVHHLHYETLGHESLDDLIALCEGCHAEADTTRIEEGSEGREAWRAAYASRVRNARSAARESAALKNRIAQLSGTKLSPPLPPNATIQMQMLEDFDSCQFKFYKSFVETSRLDSSSRSMKLRFAQFLRREFGIALARFKPGEQLNTRIVSLEMVGIQTLFEYEFLSNKSNGLTYFRTFRDNPNEYRRDFSGIISNFLWFVEKYLQGKTILSVKGDFLLVDPHTNITGEYDLITRDSNDDVSVWFWRTGSKRREEMGAKRLRAYLASVWAQREFGGRNFSGNMVFLQERDNWEPYNLDRAASDFSVTEAKRWRDVFVKAKTYPTNVSKLCDWCLWKSRGCPAHAAKI